MQDIDTILQMINLYVTKENLEKVISRVYGCGVYCFKSDSEHLYIGKSIDLKSRLLQHRARVDNMIERYGMTHMVIYHCKQDRLNDLELKAIQYHRPYFNKRDNNDTGLIEIKIMAPSFLAYKYKKLVLSSPDIDSKTFGIEGIEHVIKKYAVSG